MDYWKEFHDCKERLERCEKEKDRLKVERDSALDKLYGIFNLSRFRGLEYVVATIYPTAIFFYLLLWLLFSEPGSDIRAAYAVTLWGRIIYSLCISMTYWGTAVLANYICRCDPLMGLDLPSRNGDISSQMWRFFKLMLTSSFPRMSLVSFLWFVSPIGLFLYLWSISALSGAVFLLFGLVAYGVSESLWASDVIGKPVIAPLIAFALLLILGFFAERLGTYVGSMVVISIACLSWQTIASSFVIRARRYMSLFLVNTIIIVAVIVIILNLPYVESYLRWSNTMPHAITDMPLIPLDNAYAQYRAHRQSEIDARHPVIFVAAAGGGLRAAIWTQDVLNYLNKTLPGFEDDLFVISGVSGGSLGAAYYLADIKAGSAECRSDAKAEEDCTDAFMETDFLGGPLASLLSTDLPSAIAGRESVAPLHRLFQTRDEVLTSEWSRRWGELRRSNEFGEPFLNLWNKYLPGLIINTTSAYYGDRVFVSNINLEEVYSRTSGGVSNLGSFDLSLSEAVSLGARFPIVSEAEKINAGDGKTDAIVDGGYFDNFGALIINEIINHLIEKDHLMLSQVIVIQITNDKSVGNILSAETADGRIVAGCEPKSGPFENMLPPLIDSLGALDIVRTARGLDASIKLSKIVRSGKGIYLHFGLLDYDAPLSWTLSHETNQKIAGEIKSPCNLDDISTLRGILVDDRSEKR